MSSDKRSVIIFVIVAVLSFMLVFALFPSMDVGMQITNVFNPQQTYRDLVGPTGTQNRGMLYLFRAKGTILRAINPRIAGQYTFRLSYRMSQVGSAFEDIGRAAGEPDGALLIAVFIYFATLTIWAFISWRIGAKKGRQLVGLLCGFLGLVGLVIILVVPEDARTAVKRQTSSGEVQKCPHCAELIKNEAVVCRYCGRDVVVGQ